MQYKGFHFSDSLSLDLRRNSQVQKPTSWLEPVRRQTSKDGAERCFSAESSRFAEHTNLFDFFVNFHHMHLHIKRTT